MEIHYSDLFTLSRDVIIIDDKRATTFKRYTEGSSMNLPQEYLYISKYAHTKFDHIMPLSSPPRISIIGGCDARKLRDRYVQSVGSLTLYKQERCGKRLLSGSNLCEGCHKKEMIFKETGDPATGKSKHHVTWHGVISEPPPDWSHVEGTQWHRDNESDI
jgi:hypothetical protein